MGLRVHGTGAGKKRPRRPTRRIAGLASERAATSLHARILQTPKAMEIKARQELELRRLPSAERRALLQKGYSTTPIRGHDYTAFRYQGTEIPVTPTGVVTDYKTLRRTLQKTLRHELGHQRLWLRGIPATVHHDILPGAPG